MKRPLVILSVFTLLVIGWLNIGQSAVAAEQFVPEIPIPGTDFAGSQDIDNNLFGKYVRAIYIYFIWVVGIIATFMVVYAGVKWVAAAGNPARINDARETINNAIIGVIIALTSVVLLNLLSPSFTTLSIPGTKDVQSRNYEGAFITRPCKPDLANNQASDASLAELKCGTVFKIGTMKDQDGVDQNTYCIGTVCAKEEICQLTQNASTGYYKALSGCVKNVVPENPVGPYQSITTIPVKDDTIAGTICGKITPTRANYACHDQAILGNHSICYMIGPKVTIVDEPPPAALDTATNIKCTNS